MIPGNGACDIFHGLLFSLRKEVTDLTRGEAVTWLRKYKKDIPIQNFRYGDLMKNQEFLWSSRAMFTADELIFRIQERDCDPLEVVRDWCNVMSNAMIEIEDGHIISLRYAGMMEAIGRDILRCMRAVDKKITCRTQIKRMEKRFSAK